MLNTNAMVKTGQKFPAVTALFFTGLIIILFGSCAADPGTLEKFPLSSVTITDGPFLNARDVSLQYILELDMERLLSPFLIEAGLEPAARIYGDWERGGLSGQTGGHYLTALSLMYVSTGDPLLRERLDYMINQLARCQEMRSDGYVGGIPGGAAMWKEIAEGNIRANPFSLNGKWVPWYNIHKLYAGLRDAYLIAGNEKALVILTDLSDWCVDLIANLSDEQMQDMLRCEFGGMNEVLADLYDITGDGKYLHAAKRFSHRVVLDPLLDGRDELTGMHANTQIPKIIGFKRIAELSDDQQLAEASQFFWNTIVENRTVSIGGNSVREHFNPVDDFSDMMEVAQGPETCNTYNMLRLSMMLFLSDPDARYMDYYERALYNHILSSQHPEKGGYVYLTPMRPKHYRIYSQPHESFWCCVGTGLENHGKYQEMIYARSGDDLYVNLFVPSTLEWEERGITLRQSTAFPFEDSSTLEFTLERPRTFTLRIRYPGWVEEGTMRVQVNGEEISNDNSPGSWVSVNRRWRTGDIVSLQLPMHTSLEILPDGSPWVSLLHGPIVLAAPTGREDMKGLFAFAERMHWDHIANEGKLYPIEEVPRLSAEHLTDLNSHIIPADDKRLAFRFSNKVISPDEKAGTLELVPFFTVHGSRYIIYWPVE